MAAMVAVDALDVGIVFVVIIILPIIVILGIMLMTIGLSIIPSIISEFVAIKILLVTAGFLFHAAVLSAITTKSYCKVTCHANCLFA